MAFTDQTQKTNSDKESEESAKECAANGLLVEQVPSAEKLAFMSIRSTLAKQLESHRRKRGGSKVPRALASGSAIFSMAVWAAIAHSLHLTERELQIVRGVFDDHTEYAIAANLGISMHTVHTHLERLRHKLAAKDRAGLILRIVEEFLALTATRDSDLPPICGKRTAGLCHLRD